jgi:hypothetical protein
MPADLAAIAPKLDPLIRRLDTNHGGERLARMAALERTLATAKASFHDLADCVTGAKPTAPRTSPRHHWRARPMPDAFTALDTLLDCLWLTTWESDFLESIGRQLSAPLRQANRRPRTYVAQVPGARRMSVLCDRSPAAGDGVLRERLLTACREADLNQKALTVLSEARDPYRLDTPAMHRAGAWVAEQMTKPVCPHADSPARPVLRAHGGWRRRQAGRRSLRQQRRELDMVAGFSR